MTKLFLPALLLPLAGLAFADMRSEEAEERRRQLKNDLTLIESIVNTGLELAGADSPVERAQVSNGLARRLSEEMHKAVTDRDRDRASVLGAHVQAVLVRGVAGNLNAASGPKATAIGVPQPLALMMIEQVEQVSSSIEKEIQRMPAAEREYMLPALESVTKGQLEVQKALKGRESR
jgi:hypothetical protein